MAQVFVSKSGFSRETLADWPSKTKQRSNLQAVIEKWFNVTPHEQLEDFTFDLAVYIMMYADAKELKAMNDNLITRKLIDIIKKDQRFNDDLIEELPSERVTLLKRTIGVDLSPW